MLTMKVMLYNWIRKTEFAPIRGEEKEVVVFLSGTETKLSRGTIEE